MTGFTRLLTNHAMTTTECKLQPQLQTTLLCKGEATDVEASSTEIGLNIIVDDEISAVASCPGLQQCHLSMHSFIKFLGISHSDTLASILHANESDEQTNKNKMKQNKI